MSQRQGTEWHPSCQSQTLFPRSFLSHSSALAVPFDVPKNPTLKAGLIIWQGNHVWVGCGDTSSSALAEIFLGMSSMIAPSTVHAVVGVVEVTRVTLQVFSRVLSLRCGDYSRCRGRTDGICPDSFQSLVGIFLKHTLEFASRFALVFP